MCDPISMTVIAVASTAVGVIQQVRQAKKQTAAIENQLQVAKEESNDKASAKINERLREMRREQARVKVAAGEAGLQIGGSIDALLMDSLMQTSLAGERIIGNRDREHKNFDAEAKSMKSQINKPSLLSAGLQIASAGVGAYNTGQSLKIARQ